MTNEKAFKKVGDRFKNDIGETLKLIRQVRTDKDWLPWWGVLRMMFPVAEAIGDLIYHKEKSSDNLSFVLRKELKQYNDGYDKVAAIIILSYRHALMHQDEVRVIESRAGSVGWKITFGDEHKKNHLKIKQESAKPPFLLLEFNIEQFYDDLMRLCDEKARHPNSEAASRYEEWRILKIDSPEHKNGEMVKEARKEITALLAEFSSA